MLAVDPALGTISSLSRFDRDFLAKDKRKGITVLLLPHCFLATPLLPQTIPLPAEASHH